MKQRLIHAESKLELARAIALSTPIGERQFRIAQQVPPSGYLIDFDHGCSKLGWLSVRRLQKELGVLPVRCRACENLPAEWEMTGEEHEEES